MFKVWLEMSMLAFEAQQAIWLRSIKIAAGGRAAERETSLMMSEKVFATQTDLLKAVTGTGPVGIIRGYRRKVRATTVEVGFRRELDRRGRHLRGAVFYHQLCPEGLAYCPDTRHRRFSGDL